VGFTSGPKIAHFDRVEWLTLDTFSAMAALQKGEIDWWETPPRDLIGQIGRDRDVTAVSQYATAMGILRFNHVHPPFDNPAVRRALLGAVDQAEAMTAVAGEDPTAWYDGVGLFSTGTPLANDAGVEIMRTPRDYASVLQQLERRLQRRNGRHNIPDRSPRDAEPFLDRHRPAPSCRHEGRPAGNGFRHCCPTADQPGAARQGRLECVL
jgi:hypothetical protein